jgi:hypothetical protein
MGGGGHGYRSGTRHAFSRDFRKKGPIHLTDFLRVYKVRRWGARHRNSWDKQRVAAAGVSGSHEQGPRCRWRAADGAGC